MKDPCRWCGSFGRVRYRWDKWANGMVRETDDHPCPAWAVPPRLDPTPTDVTFLTAGRNDPAALALYRRSVRR